MIDRWIDVDLDAYRRNLALVRSTVAPANVMVIVKNNAYGHGLEMILGEALGEGITQVGVLDPQVGVDLRAAGIDESILLFAWLLPPEYDYAAAVSAGVDLGVSTIEQLDRIIGSGAGRPARIHLKIDTGLGRAGARPEDWPDLVARAVAAEDLGAVTLVGVWTHIAEASDEEDSASIAAFEHAIKIVPWRRPPLRHLAASAAAFSREDSRFDTVRVGAFTYGIAPGGGVSPTQLGLIPVMALRARLTHVSVDGTATLPLGLVDGIPELHGAKVFCSWRGRRVPIVAVHTTSTTIHAPGAISGEVVTLFGSQLQNEPTLQEWADELGTIGEELAVRLAGRLVRRYSGARFSGPAR